jgi:hypothetical protein
MVATKRKEDRKVFITTKPVKSSHYYGTGRLHCPRCGGFLIDASERYVEYAIFYKGKKHCLICGRDWQIVRKDENSYIMERFPYVKEWEERKDEEG